MGYEPEELSHTVSKEESSAREDVPVSTGEWRLSRTWLEAEGFDYAPEGGTVVSACFLCEAKQGEEEECSARVDPATHLKRDRTGLVGAPDDGRDLEDVPELVVGVGP